MIYLFDTHSFIWADGNAGLLSPKAKSILSDPQNVFLLSVASVWEMQIKSQIGKLTLRASLEQIVREQVHANPIRLLPVTVDHIWALNALPLFHRDPFDRLLIAQAIAEGVVLLSRDPQMKAYPVMTDW